MRKFISLSRPCLLSTFQQRTLSIVSLNDVARSCHKIMEARKLYRADYVALVLYHGNRNSISSFQSLCEAEAAKKQLFYTHRDARGILWVGVRHDPRFPTKIETDDSWHIAKKKLLKKFEVRTLKPDGSVTAQVEPAGQPNPHRPAMNAAQSDKVNPLDEIVSILADSPSAMPIGKLWRALSQGAKDAVAKGGKGPEGYLKAHPTIFSVEAAQKLVKLLDGGAASKATSSFLVSVGETGLRSIPPLPLWNPGGFYTPVPYKEGCSDVAESSKEFPIDPYYLKTNGALRPNMASISELLRYIPAVFCKSGQIKLSHEIRITLLGHGISFHHWAAYLPRYFDVEGHQTTFANVRRSPLLHPKECGMTPEQAAQYVAEKLKVLKIEGRPRGF